VDRVRCDPAHGSAAAAGQPGQGGDGNQDNASSLIDWEGLQLEGRAQHTSDPNAEDESAVVRPLDITPP